MTNVQTITGKHVTKKYINTLDNYIDIIMHGANKKNHSNKRR